MACALIVGVNNLVEQSMQPLFCPCIVVRFSASARAVAFPRALVKFARHRGISTAALRQILSGRGNPTGDTLNKVVSIFGLEVGLVPKRPRDSTPPGPKGGWAE